MRIYSQKELLAEGFFDKLIKTGKKTAKVMQTIDPKASEPLLKPFKQTRDIYRSINPATPELAKDSQSEFVSSSKTEAVKFAQKNPKIVKKILDTEKDFYNRVVDPSSVSVVNMKLPDGKAIQNIIVVSKDIGSKGKTFKRYLYSKEGKFLKNL